MSTRKDEFEWVDDPEPEAPAQSGELEAIVIEELTEPDQLALLPADTEGMTQGQWITARGDAFVAIENKR